MRRLLSALLLTLCLASSQQGALLHALRHDLAAAGLATVDEEKSRPAGVGCAVCLAFAHVAGAVTSAVIAPVLLSLEFHWSVAQAFLQRAAEAPHARSRGPPAVFRSQPSLIPLAGNASENLPRLFGDQKKVLPCSSPCSAA